MKTLFSFAVSASMFFLLMVITISAQVPEPSQNPMMEETVEVIKKKIVGTKMVFTMEDRAKITREYTEVSLKGTTLTVKFEAGIIYKNGEPDPNDSIHTIEIPLEKVTAIKFEVDKNKFDPDYYLLKFGGTDFIQYSTAKDPLKRDGTMFSNSNPIISFTDEYTAKEVLNAFNHAVSLAKVKKK